MIINEVIRKFPKTMKVFKEFKVDSCCGGGYSIEKTATDDGADLIALLKALNECAEK
jgi:regulator of cell morphogenesis and NO signaling